MRGSNGARARGAAVALLASAAVVGGAAAVAADRDIRKPRSVQAWQQLVARQASHCLMSPTYDAGCGKRLRALQAEALRQHPDEPLFQLFRPLGSAPSRVRSSSAAATAPHASPVARAEEDRRKKEDPFYVGGELDF